MSVRRAQQEIDSREFTEWAAIAKHEPLGYERIDVAAALICTTVASMFRGKGSPAPKLADFMCDYWKPERPTKEQLTAQMNAWAAQLNARVRMTK